MYIDHIAIWTEDLELVKDFYLKYFKCKAGKLYKNEKKLFSSYFLTFESGARIEIMNRKGIDSNDSNLKKGLTHFALIVGTSEKVDKLTQRLKNDGYTIEGEPRTTGDGYYESVVLDPEGNRIELTAHKDLEIEKATEEDLEEILFLQKCCYISEAEIYSNYTLPPIVQTLEDIKKDFQHQIILKLCIQNKIIGSIRGYFKDNTCHIGRIIVAKEWQNMGFGSKLLQSIEQEFLDAKRFELFTGSISHRNLYLYEKNGYVNFKEITPQNQPKLIYLEKIN